MPTYNINKEEIEKFSNDKSIKRYFNKKDPNNYILRYNKNEINDFGIYGKYRSIVLNKDNNIIAFSPPKSTNFEDFHADFIQNHFTNIIVEELVEGTMINLFFDDYEE